MRQDILADRLHGADPDPIGRVLTIGAEGVKGLCRNALRLPFPDLVAGQEQAGPVF